MKENVKAQKAVQIVLIVKAFFLLLFYWIILSLIDLLFDIFI
jgi:hypothetical protein